MYAVFGGEKVPVKAELTVKAAQVVKTELNARGFKVLVVRQKRHAKRTGVVEVNHITMKDCTAPHGTSQPTLQALSSPKAARRSLGACCRTC